MMFKLFLICVVLAMSYSKNVDPRPRVDFPLEITNIILKAMRSCLAEYNIDPEVIDEIRNGEYRNDVPYQKFIYCSFRNSGFVDEDGYVKVNKSAKAFPRRVNILPVLKNCYSLAKGETAFEVTFSFFKCFQETSPVLMALTPKQ